MWIYGEEVTFQGASWLDGWKYRKSHEIIGSPAGAQSNYQIRFKAIYGFFYPELVLIAPHSGYKQGVTYAVVDGYLYWGVNYGGGTEGYIYKTDLATLETATLYTGNYKAEWQGVKVGDRIYAVGEEKDSGGTFRSSIHIINTLNDNVTAVRHPDTGDCNELIGVDTDGEIIVAGERVGGGDTTGSSWPNGGGVWKIPIESITDPSTWERTWEDPNHYGCVSIAYFNGKWYAMLISSSLEPKGRWRVISSSDLVNWTTELDYTTQDVGFRSDAGLTKCGDKLVALAPVADTGTFHMFVFDGTSWIDHDLGIEIPSEDNAIVGVWNSSVNRLIIAVDYMVSVKHDIYSINLDGSKLMLEKAGLSRMFSRPSSCAGDNLTYNGKVYYGGIAPSGGTGSFHRLKFDDEDEMFFLHGKARTDFGDIRFTDSDALTELTYWMEEKVDGEYAIFWVKVPSIPESPNAVTIYVYYGKSDASTTSNGEQTFPLWFDDFDDGVVASEYVRIQGNEGLSESNGILYINPNTDAAAQGVYINITTPSNVRVVAKGREASDAPTNTQNKQFGVYGRYTNLDNYYYLRCVDNDSVPVRGKYLTKRVGGSETHLDIAESGVDILPAKWHVFDLHYYGTSVKGVIRKPDGTEVSLSGTDSELTSGYVGLFVGWDDFAYNFEFDYVFIASYVDPEPSHGDWGAEESI